MALFVKAFQKGNWLKKSNSMLSDKTKVLALLAQFSLYFRKGGLEKVSADLKLLSGFLLDVFHGKYKDANRVNLTLALAAVIYVVSPLDLVPDFLPLGFVDDVAIVSWAIAKLATELERYKTWKRNRELESSRQDDKSLSESVGSSYTISPNHSGETIEFEEV